MNGTLALWGMANIAFAAMLAVLAPNLLTLIPSWVSRTERRLMIATVWVLELAMIGLIVVQAVMLIRAVNEAMRIGG